MISGLKLDLQGSSTNRIAHVVLGMCWLDRVMGCIGEGLAVIMSLFVRNIEMAV